MLQVRIETRLTLHQDILPKAIIPIYIYIYISNIQSVSEDSGCGLFVYIIYEEYQINLCECSMNGYCYIPLMHTHMHNTTIHNKDERHSSLEKCTSHFIERVVCERELKTEQNCNICNPTLLAITAFLSRSPGLLKRGPGGLGPSLSECWFSLPHLISNSSDPQLPIGGLRAPSAGAGSLYRILSPTGLVSKLIEFPVH